MSRRVEEGKKRFIVEFFEVVVGDVVVEGAWLVVVEDRSRLLG